MWTVAKLIRRYGETMVLVHSGEQTQISGFLQETQSRSKEKAQRDFSPLGEESQGRYVYIGPAEPQVFVGDELICRQRRFELQQAELVKVGDRALYCWGLCTERVGDGTWGSGS